MAKKIAVSIRKGGSSKTTTATNLATGLHLKGKRVLLVDLDPQANATLAVGIDPLETEANIATLFSRGDVQPHKAITTSHFGLSVLPSHPDLAKVEQGIGTLDFDLLEGILKAVEGDFDFIVIDTPPAESKLTLNALATADEVLIPLQAHFLALQGLQQALEEIRIIQKKINQGLKITGVLPTQVQAQTNMAKMIMEQLQTEYPELVLPYQVEFSVRFVESQLAGVPLVLYDTEHKASKTYISIAERLINGK